MVKLLQDSLYYSAPIYICAKFLNFTFAQIYEEQCILLWQIDDDLLYNMVAILIKY